MAFKSKPFLARNQPGAPARLGFGVDPPGPDGDKEPRRALVGFGPLLQAGTLVVSNFREGEGCSIDLLDFNRDLATSNRGNTIEGEIVRFPLQLMTDWAIPSVLEFMPVPPVEVEHLRDFALISLTFHL